jgi:hypothetical protein
MSYYLEIIYFTQMHIYKINIEKTNTKIKIQLMSFQI